VRKLGLDDEGVLELMAVVDLFSGLNKLMDGLRVELDEKPCVRLSISRQRAVSTPTDREGRSAAITPGRSWI
jgi:hypothetical protein